MSAAATTSQALGVRLRPAEAESSIHFIDDGSDVIDVLSPTNSTSIGPGAIPRGGGVRLPSGGMSTNYPSAVDYSFRYDSVAPANHVYESARESGDSPMAQQPMHEHISAAEVESGRDVVDVVNHHAADESSESVVESATPPPGPEEAEETVIDKFGFIVNDANNAASANTTGQQPTRPAVDPKKIRQREKKWLNMFNQWHFFMEKRYSKVRERCRKGIPPALRGRAWCHLCGAKFEMDDKPDLFRQLDAAPGDPQWVDLIERDVHRQFPTHELFVKRGGIGQTEMLRILKAYSILRPTIGYCQAMAPIAGTLLTEMPVEQAFFCFVALCDRYIKDYYNPGLEEVQTDGEVLNELLKRLSPRAYKHLKKQGITYHQYMIEWFMCLFTRTLPWSTLLRIWDVFLCEGIKFIFRVGLVLLRDLLGHRGIEKQCPSDWETLQLLKDIPSSVVDEELLIRRALELPVTDGDMQRAHQKVRQEQLKLQKKEQEKAITNRQRNEQNIGD